MKIKNLIRQFPKDAGCGYKPHLPDLGKISNYRNILLNFMKARLQVITVPKRVYAQPRLSPPTRAALIFS